MFEKKNVEKILYGGDYNPEQWPEEVWQEDMRLLKQAGMDIVTLNVFSWALLQSSEEEYHFEKLDKIMELVQDHGMKVCMATSTAVHPAWMARKYPDVLRVDFEGRKRKFGGRANSCPNSPTYRKFWPVSWQNVTGITTISWRGTFPMSTVERVTVKTARKTSGFGCKRSIRRLTI